MTNPAPQPDMAWHLRRLLEAVKEAACGLEGRWGWLTAPMLLLTWLWTRRERREAAEAMQAVQALLEGFLTLLEDFRAGKLAEGAAPAVEIAADESTGTDHAVAYPSPSRIGPPILQAKMGSVAGPSSVRFAAQPLRGRGIQGAEGADHAAAPATPTAGFPARGGHVGPPTQWIPAPDQVGGRLFAGMTGTVGAGGAMVGPGSGCCRNDGRTFNFYRRKWRISGFVARAPPEGRLRKSRRRRRGLLRRNSC